MQSATSPRTDSNIWRTLTPIESAMTTQEWLVENGFQPATPEMHRRYGKFVKRKGLIARIRDFWTAVRTLEQEQQRVHLMQRELQEKIAAIRIQVSTSADD